jgi:MFS family permease
MEVIERTHPGHRLWLLELTASERATLIATFCGWALDGMDAMIYSFVIPVLMAEWRMSQGEAGVLSTVPLMVSAVGGWLAGALSDRFGRARILQLTILWFAVFTFLSGFTHSFWQPLVTRSLQGLGFGGEWAVGAVLMGEAIRAQFRGKAVGTVQSGWAIGWGITAFARLCNAVSPSTRQHRLARDVLDRHYAIAFGVLHPAACSGTRGFRQRQVSRGEFG